ncbi:glutamate-rich WD repeat-containing protein [Planoprotostelium fungivorum]|uniref:Glutamate-rich WD repeat-containing protein 1 n=1 Tax=Planoprotostelium fungivorum TaxID=1890364 RepID=A0A2P6MSV4_9EUKA|nr:glutamate-rich WD repeat-containing protein [Planoprotostelium fungivorum]
MKGKRDRSDSNAALDKKSKKEETTEPIENDDNSENEAIPDDLYEDEYDEEDLELLKRAEQLNMEGGDEVDEDDSGKEEEAMVEDEEEEESSEKKVQFKEVYKGEAMEEGEVLDYDSSAYDMFHQLTMEWPCLSFDIFPDTLGENRGTYPHTVYFVGGTQADHFTTNKLLIAKATQLHRTKYDDDPEYENEDDEDMDDEAEMDHRTLSHPGSVNRLKVMPQAPHYVSTWSEDGSVRIWDLSHFIDSLDNKSFGKTKTADHLVKVIKSHSEEGFALSWSPHTAGRLLSGDLKKFIYLTEMREGGQFVESATPFSGHTKSVEDLHWSPTEATVFSSCSSDKTIKIWDTRQNKQPARSFFAADRDVNVISWNRSVPYLLASGDDAGIFKVWDLRSLKSGQSCESIGHYKWHKDQITSIEWDPNDDSVIAVAGADDQLTIWDLSVERDTETETIKDGEAEYPPQLLFVHQGQKDIKELHWHKQIPDVIMSTAEDSLNIIRPNISEDIQQEDE